MLGLLGLKPHPAVKALIGAALIVLGVARHHAVPIALLGGAVIVWGLVDVAMRPRGAQDG